MIFHPDKIHDKIRFWIIGLLTKFVVNLNWKDLFFYFMFTSTQSKLLTQISQVFLSNITVKLIFRIYFNRFW